MDVEEMEKHAVENQHHLRLYGGGLTASEERLVIALLSVQIP